MNRELHYPEVHGHAALPTVSWSPSDPAFPSETPNEIGAIEDVSELCELSATHLSSRYDRDVSPEEAMAAKAPTITVESPQAALAAESHDLSEPVHWTYIQGLVQGQQAFIITNLLEGGISQTIYQPQMAWSIGRNRESALPFVKDRAMSRRHAVLLYTSHVGFQLLDLHSLNGSFVNGVRVKQRCLLKDGDRICLGSTRFTFLSSTSSRIVDAIHPEVLTRFNRPPTTAGLEFGEEANDDLSASLPSGHR